MRSRTPLLTMLTVLGLLALTGPGCSDDNKGGAGVAAMCAQLDAKQNELDCKVAALGVTCAATDTACATKKDAGLAKCNSLTTANWTSIRTSACGAGSATSTSSSTSTGTTTSSSSTAAPAVTTSFQTPN